MVAYIRSGSAAGGSLLNTLVSFIDSQGASFRVMVKTFDYGEYLDTANGWRYLFFPLELFLNNNSIGQSVFHTTPILTLQTAEFAEHTYSYSHVITYLVDPAKFCAAKASAPAMLRKPMWRSVSAA